MSSSDLVFYVQLQVKPECVQEWKESVIEVIHHMSEEPTFVTCYLHQDTQDANRFILYERWRESSLEAFIKNQFEAKKSCDNSKNALKVTRLMDWINNGDLHPSSY